LHRSSSIAVACLAGLLTVLVSASSAQKLIATNWIAGYRKWIGTVTTDQLR
jgi:hypothetical protein